MAFLRDGSFPADETGMAKKTLYGEFLEVESMAGWDTADLAGFLEKVINRVAQQELVLNELDEYKELLKRVDVLEAKS